MARDRGPRRSKASLQKATTLGGQPHHCAKEMAELGVTEVGVGLPRSNRTLPQGRSLNPEMPLALVVRCRPSGRRCPPLAILRFLMMLWPHWPPIDTLALSMPQGFCTCSSCCRKGASPRASHLWLLLLLLVSAQKSPLGESLSGHCILCHSPACCLPGPPGTTSFTHLLVKLLIV